MFERFSIQSLAVLSLLVSLSVATPGLPIGARLDERAGSGYAPYPVPCPDTPLIRDANSISSAEASWRAARYTKASSALATWLSTTALNGTFNSSTKMPTIALTTSGGGYRSLLVGAGVIQAFDNRDSSSPVAGIYQASTYHAALSGGSWLVSTMAGNNFPTISYLQTNLWNPSLSQNGTHHARAEPHPNIYQQVALDVEAKKDAGFEPNLDGGVKTRLSDIAGYSSFISHDVPYPIIAVDSVRVWDGESVPPADGAAFEFHPYEYGSWDKAVSAFAHTKYMGSCLSNGKPVNGNCIANYDNLGYVFGTSSALFNEICNLDNLTSVSKSSPFSADNATIDFLCHLDNLTSISSSSTTTPAATDSTTTVPTDTLSTAKKAKTNPADTPTSRALYAVYPNPFHLSHSTSPSYTSQPSLYLVDGGEAHQSDAIWPLLQPSLFVSAILVSDNSADLKPSNFPSGTQLYAAYLQSLPSAANLTRMPAIPAPAEFVAKGLNIRATFFGCKATEGEEKILIVYLPNREYSYRSGTSTWKLSYSPEEIEGMVGNGREVAMQGRKEQEGEAWRDCLACGIMRGVEGTGELDVCRGCFERYCYN